MLTERIEQEPHLGTDSPRALPPQLSYRRDAECQGRVHTLAQLINQGRDSKDCLWAKKEKPKQVVPRRFLCHLEKVVQCLVLVLDLPLASDGCLPMVEYHLPSLLHPPRPHEKHYPYSVGALGLIRVPILRGSTTQLKEHEVQSHTSLTSDFALCHATLCLTSEKIIALRLSLLICESEN